MGVKGQLGNKGKALGVVAPAAPKGTPLEKDGGAYTIAVVYGKAFDIGNDRSFHTSPFADPIGRNVTNAPLPNGKGAFSLLYGMQGEL